MFLITTLSFYLVNKIWWLRTRLWYKNCSIFQCFKQKLEIKADRWIKNISSNRKDFYWSRHVIPSGFISSQTGEDATSASCRLRSVCQVQGEKPTFTERPVEGTAWHQHTTSSVQKVQEMKNNTSLVLGTLVEATDEHKLQIQVVTTDFKEQNIDMRQPANIWPTYCFKITVRCVASGSSGWFGNKITNIFTASLRDQRCLSLISQLIRRTNNWFIQKIITITEWFCVTLEMLNFFLYK